MKTLKKLYKILIICVLAMMIIPAANVYASEDVSLVNRQFLNDINNLRASQGLEALSMDASLVNIAQVRAQEASTTWSHTRPNGKQGITMLPADKWRGENLAYVQYGSFTYTQQEQVAAEKLMFENLKASPTHYKNMVFENFTKIGICTYVSQTGSGYKLTTAFMFSN